MNRTLRPEPNLDPSLNWQSKAILLLFLPVLAAHLLLFFGSGLNLAPGYGVGKISATALIVGMALAVLLGLIVWATRASTLGGALAGALVTATFALATPGWRSSLWPLAALLLMTLAGTRLGRRTKERIGVAEDRQGRQAAQVTANLGVAAMAALLLSFFPEHGLVLRLALVAALAEAAADTLSSELGQVLGGEPRLLTSLARVPRGTDGAVTVAGTLCGWAAAATVVGVASLALGLGLRSAVVVWLAAVLGGFFDSLLGACCEQRGWLNNDAVNLLSTLFAACLAVLAYAKLA